MKYFFIDYENVKQNALKGLEQLSVEDKVVVFYSENAQTMSISMHLQINESNSEFLFKRVQVGHKNDLDFQLATELGSLIGSGVGDAYYIVSYDKGYESVCRYWKENGVEVARIECLGDAFPKRRVKEGSKGRKRQGHKRSAVQQDSFSAGDQPDGLESRVKEVVPDDEAAEIVTQILRKHDNKQDVNNALMKAFPSEGNRVAAQLYKLIKPLIPSKKKSK